MSGAWLKIFSYGDLVLQDPIHTRTYEKGNPDEVTTISK